MNQKWVFVTGGAKGIGRSISVKLAEEGYSLILLGRDETSLKEVSSQIQKTNKVGVETFPVDLSLPGAGAHIFEALLGNRIPFPAGLICNAGSYGELGSLAEVDFQNWKKSFDLNFFSAAELIQVYLKAARRFPSVERRKIILMSGSGLGGSKVWGGISAYACAKAALYRLMEVLHEEVYSQGIDINCVAPGAVKTGITDQAEEAGERALGPLYYETLKVKDNGGDSPLLAADMIAYLMSSKCDGLSGRLVSAKWDQKTLQNPDRIAEDRDLLRLRRIDDELFCKKPSTSK